MLIFTLLLIVLFVLVWLTFQLFGFAYRAALAAGVEFIYGLFGRSYEFRSFGTELAFRSFSRPTFEATLSMEGVVANIVFLLSLVLATPGMNLANRAVRTILSVLMLFLGHVLFLIIKVEVSLIATGHPAAGSPIIWNTMDNFFEITGRVFLPILFWLLLTLPYMLGAVDCPRETQEVRSVGRNAPCPCGSGKKYKYCCGR